MTWTLQWVSVMALSYAALLLALGWPYIFGTKIKPGDLAERNYIAHTETQVVDVEATKRAHEEIRDNTVPVFRKSQARVNASLQKLRRLTNAVRDPQSHQPSPAEEKLIANISKHVDDQNHHHWRLQTETAAQQFLKTAPLYPDTTKSSWHGMVFEYLPDSMPQQLRTHTSALIAHALQPNMMLDAEATHERFKENLQQAEPVTRNVDSGTLLIRRGDKLTTEDVNLLNRMGITRTRDIGHLLGIAIALLAALCVFGVYLFAFASNFFFSPSALGLMATVSVVTCGIATAVGRDFPEFIPLPGVALVLSVICGRRIAVFIVMLLILFLKLSDLVDPAPLIALAAASGIALGTNITHRKELMLTGIMIGVVQAITWSFTSMLYTQDGAAMPIVFGLVRNLLGGLSSAIVAIGSLPFLEIIFGILTPFRVAELSEPDQPLLRLLEEKAPGTYQHSLAVANLAEAGAKAIGADVNLVRAGAMYHDIGKMANSRYFIENQLGDKNPHDEIQPEESRARVLAHVTDGLEMAKKYGLPRQVKDFIPEHQGTTVMAYFYHKACMRDGHENVREADYRYPGPKPQCKETAIVMLADVSEAVTHSLKNPTQEEVEKAINNVFKARWDDGQFDDSGLTEDELEKVKQGFARVWRTLNHDRLKYPSTTTGKMPVPPERISNA